ncbi:MAG: hypothetical protein ACQKBW_03270 [Puniceicoccales bacterium]
MTISELQAWQDKNQLADTWYCEIDQQGWGSVLSLSQIEKLASRYWPQNVTVRAIHTDQAAPSAKWITLEPRAENECPCCGNICEASTGVYPGPGISTVDWLLTIFISLPMMLMLGKLVSVWIGGLLIAGVALFIVRKHMPYKRPIWVCPHCHSISPRKRNT